MKERSNPALEFVTLPDLLDEIRRRSASICVSLIPIMQEDAANNEEAAYTAIEGSPTDLAWMAMLIMTEVQVSIMHHRREQIDPDSDPKNSDQNQTENQDDEGRQ